jgi:hypothetical protein
MRIVVTGLIATYPLGGVSWDYIQYIQGFRLLGHEVHYLEDTGQWVYNPQLRTFAEDCSSNLRYLEKVLAVVGPEMTRRWSFRSPTGKYFGLAQRQIERVCSQADIFLNVSGCCLLRELYRGCSKKVYIDSDPLYTQYKLEAVRKGAATPNQAGAVDLILNHDFFLTFAENIGDPSCQVPLCGLTWQKTRQPIVLEAWPFTLTPEARAFTTVMSWKTDVTPPSLAGNTYGGKDIEFMKFIDLPSRVSMPLQLALSGAAPLDQLRRHGWQVVDAYDKSSTMDQYRDYLRSSRGEWSVAKQAYVATKSGWFSCRSAAYLAMGKPVVVEDTGFSLIYPTGEGVWAFQNVEQAATAIEAVNANYRQQCEAARSIAEQYFRAEVVLGQLLHDVGL